MIKTYKVKLKPNNKQQTKMFQFCGAKRFAYNWAIAKEKENYFNGGKFVSDSILRKEFTQLKKTEEYKWLYSISNNVTKQAIKDACVSYKRFFQGYSKAPKFKSKRTDRPSFYVDNIKIKFTNDKVKLENIAISKKKNKAKLNWIRLAEKNKIPINCKYINPHVVYNGIDWFICVGIEMEDNKVLPANDGIGIDLGVKDLAICSDGNTYKNINKTQKIKKLEKQLKREQKRLSRKYESFKLKNKNKKGEATRQNIQKQIVKVQKLHQRLSNKRTDYINKIVNEIVKTKPSHITIEDLNISGMMKNSHLSKAISQQKFYEFRTKLKYKCELFGIELRIVDRYYPSSKLCHNCGQIKKDLKLSDRIYKCDCGYEEDRDYNASLNLRDAKKYKIA